MTRRQMIKKRNTLRKRNEIRQRFGGGEEDLPWATFSGNQLQFNAPKAHTLKSVKVEFSPIQDLHGYANPWPPGGGKNLFNKDGTKLEGYYIDNSGNFVQNAGSTLSDVYTDPIPVTGGEKYTISAKASTASYIRVAQYTTGGFIARSITNQTTNPSITLTISSNATYILISPDQSCTDIQVEKSSTATSYAPYSNLCPINGWNSIDVYDEPDYDPSAQPQTTLTFPSTVYGGTASVAEDGTGQGSGTYGMVDLGTLTWYYSPSQWAVPLFFAQIADMKPKAITHCSEMKTNVNAPFDTLGDKELDTITNNFVYIRYDDYTDENTFKSAMSGVQLAYELATPTPFTPTASATPTAVQGINTMWTDGDSLTVEARGEAVNLNALQSLNMLLGGRYYNNGTADEPSDEEALSILLGGER